MRPAFYLLSLVIVTLWCIMHCSIGEPAGAPEDVSIAIWQYRGSVCSCLTIPHGTSFIPPLLKSMSNIICTNNPKTFIGCKSPENTPSGLGLLREPCGQMQQKKVLLYYWQQWAKYNNDREIVIGSGLSDNERKQSTAKYVQRLLKPKQVDNRILFFMITDGICKITMFNIILLSMHFLFLFL